MFERLKKRLNVSSLDLDFCLCGSVGRVIQNAQVKIHTL